jgi:putative membrane-bound dehydrogenase-like protein
MRKLTLWLGLAFTASMTLSYAADGKTIVMIAGKASHGPGQHEHNAGVQLLAKCLKDSGVAADIKIHLNGEWPSPESMGKADTILIYSDGGGGHPALQGERLQELDKEMKRGAGFVALHYAVEPTTQKGNKEFIDWMGGCFETHWSVNPHWDANFKEFPAHPVANGVKPFTTNDEWYFHMRFRPNMKGVTPVLSDVPPDSTLKRPDGPHSGNPTVREAVANKKPQHVAWAAEREGGGRGFGFTGGHYHKGWANDDQRKLVLNAILWSAKIDVPAEGVASKVTEEDLKANLDPKPGQGLPEKKKAEAPKSGTAKPLFKKEIGKAEGLVEVKVSLKGAKELHLVVTEGPDGIAGDWTNWVQPTLIGADGKRTKLADLKMKKAATGWGGVVINRSAGGTFMRLEGTPEGERLQGIGTHSNSVIVFDLPAGTETFEAKVGLDEGGTKQGLNNKVIAQIFTQEPPAAILAGGSGPGGDKAYGVEDARELMKNFKTPEGLEATLFAAEPQIQNPTNLDIDAKGRVWAVESVNYRSSMKNWGILREAGDRVVILAPQKGDGVVQETTFFQSRELTNALGICVLPQDKGTKVIVSAAPHIWLLTDADGDDKAEKAEKIFSVGGNFDHDHNVHAVVFGPDGKFYFNFGNEGRELKWPDGSIVKDTFGQEITDKGKPYRQGMIFRCDIDLATGKAAHVETLGHNFRNNYELCVDSFGGMWQSDNDDDGNQGVRINAILDYGNYGYTDELTGAGWRTARTNIEEEIPLRHWHQNDPGSIPNLLQTGGGSPTGILINEGKLLGSAFENQLIHCDAGPRTVRAYPVKKTGAGYTAEMVDILTTDDTWYRPADVAIASDGSLFVADWYDPGVGGHNMGDNHAEKIRGRIYRVAPKGLPYHATASDFSSATGCAEALKSPNVSVRYVAWTKLHAMGEAAEKALLKLWDAEDSRVRARAFHLLLRIPGKYSSYLAKGLSDADEDLRVTAVRELRLAAATGKLPADLKDAASYVLDLVKQETSPQVLREYALTLRAIPGEPTDALKQTWVTLAQKHDGKDRWYLEALGIGAMGREDVFFAAWLSSVGDQWKTPAGKDVVWRMRTPAAAGYLAQLLDDKDAKDNELARYFRAFDFLPDGEAKGNTLVKLASANAGHKVIAGEALSRLGKSSFREKEEVKTVLNTVLAAAKGKPEFIEVVRNFGVSGKEAGLLDAALADPRHPLAPEAITMLLKSPQGREALTTALASPKADAVTALLGGSGDKGAVQLLTQLLTQANREAQVRAGAVKALSLSAPGAEALLKLAETGKFPADMTTQAGTALGMVQYPGISERVAKVFPAPVAAGGKSLPSIAELVKMKGDVAKGKAIYAKAESTCTLCHRVGDLGADFGPGLTEIGSKLGKDVLYESLINPNAGVSMGFETWQITLKNGSVAMGIIRSETNDQLVLALPGGVANTFEKRQIADRKKLGSSMMPAGLQAMFTQEDLVNLVEYLASLKAPSSASR